MACTLTLLFVTIITAPTFGGHALPPLPLWRLSIPLLSASQVLRQPLLPSACSPGRQRAVAATEPVVAPARHRPVRCDHRAQRVLWSFPHRSVRPQSTACPLVLPPEHPRGRHSRFPGPCIPSSSVNQSIPHVQSSLLPVLRSQPSGVYTTSRGPCQTLDLTGVPLSPRPLSYSTLRSSSFGQPPSESIPMSFLLPAGTWWPGLAAPLGCGTFPSSGQHIRPGLGCYFTLVVRPRYAESRSLLVLPQDRWAFLQAGRIPTCLGGSKSLETSAQMPPSHVSGFPVFPAWPLTLA